MNAIERVTPYPSRYAGEPEEWELKELEAAEEEQWERASAGKFWMRVEICKGQDVGRGLSVAERKDVARVVSEAVGEGAEYRRREDYYRIGEWVVTKRTITSGIFGIGERGKSIEVFAALDEAGYRAKNGMRISYRPKAARMEEAFALMAMAERELKQLEKRLHMPEEPVMSIEREGFQLYIPGTRLGYGKLEESLLTYYRLIQTAELRRGKAVAG